MQGGTGMKVKWMLTIVFAFFIMPIATAAEQLSPLEKLDEISDEALQMVKSQRYDDAKTILNYFSSEFPQVSQKDRPLTLDELRIITISHDEALEAAASPSMKYEDRMNKVTKFRLAVDALASGRHPLWVEMEKQVLGAFQQAKSAAFQKDAISFHDQFNRFLSLYDVVYPSMKIDIPAEDIQRLDAKIDAIDHSLPKDIFDSKGKQELETAQMDLENIFSKMDEDQADPSLWWVIISTGSIITMTLSYVGWRKYKGDKEERKNHSREHKN
jgi:sporulation protein YpjB